MTNTVKHTFERVPDPALVQRVLRENAALLDENKRLREALRALVRANTQGDQIVQGLLENNARALLRVLGEIE